MLRHLAPAGTPITLPLLAAWVRRQAFGRSQVDALATAVAAHVGVRKVVPVSTGRAGLVLILRALASLAPPERREVVLPSYTCYTVVASVLVAGLRPRIVDIDPATLDFAPEALDAIDYGPVLAIVATNLFGLPSDLPGLVARARRAGVRVVDDAAQALGARVGGRWSGTHGDAGLYSLDKGKNITAIEGGLAVTDDPEIAAALDREVTAFGTPSSSTVARDAVKLVAYAVLLRPWLYWLPNRIPQLGLGLTPYTPTIALERYNAPLASMALEMLGRLAAVNAARVAVARQLTAGLGSVAGVTPIEPHPAGEPVYLRYPFLVDPSRRDRLVAALRSRSIGATGSYPTALVDIPEIDAQMAPFRSACPGGRSVARRIVTLPTHAYVREGDVATMLATVREVLAGAAVPSTAPVMPHS